MSEKCDPRTEALHSKHNYNSLGFLTIPETCTRTRFWSIFRNCSISKWTRMILQHRFQASRRNCRFSSWKIACSGNLVKMHSKNDYSESLKIQGNSSVFRKCRIYSHDLHLSEIVTFLARKTRFSEMSWRFCKIATDLRESTTLRILLVLKLCLTWRLEFRSVFNRENRLILRTRVQTVAFPVGHPFSVFSSFIVL